MDKKKYLLKNNLNNILERDMKYDIILKYLDNLYFFKDFLTLLRQENHNIEIVETYNNEISYKIQIGFFFINNKNFEYSTSIKPKINYNNLAPFKKLDNDTQKIILKENEFNILKIIYDFYKFFNKDFKQNDLYKFSLYLIKKYKIKILEYEREILIN